MWGPPVIKKTKIATLKGKNPSKYLKKEKWKDQEKMASVIAMAEEQGAGDPLLQHSYTDSSNHHNEEDIVPFLSSNGPDASRTTPNQRLVSLDVFRGLTVAVRLNSYHSSLKFVEISSGLAAIYSY